MAGRAGIRVITRGWSVGPIEPAASWADSYAPIAGVRTLKSIRSSSLRLSEFRAFELRLTGTLFGRSSEGIWPRWTRRKATERDSHMLRAQNGLGSEGRQEARYGHDASDAPGRTAVNSQCQLLGYGGRRRMGRDIWGRSLNACPSSKP